MLSVARREFLTDCAERYHGSLNHECRAYLNSRGISDETIAHFSLGTFVNPEPEHLPVEGLVSIPYLTKTGVVGFKARQPNNWKDPKYRNITGQQTRMFNVLATFTDLPFVCVTEGEFDCVIATQCGLPAVAVPGIRAWKPQHPRLLDGFEHVIVLADNDEKEDGSNPGHELARAIMEDLPQAQVAWLPRGQDVNSLYLSGGRDAVIGLLPESLRKMVDSGVGEPVE